MRPIDADRGRCAGVQFAVFLAVCSVLFGCSQQPALESARQFDSIEAQFAAASDADEFAAVAAQYDQVLSAEMQSGVMFYNQGNAWMRAGEVGRAIASWRQAQRYRPRDPYLRASLQNALAACGSNAAVAPGSGVAGHVFFWQDWLSYPEKFRVTTGLLLSMIVLGIVRQIRGKHRGLKYVTVGCGGLCLLLAVSAWRDWQRYEQTTHGVVIQDRVVARKGNTDSYAAAFTEPLREGREFVVLERRADWLNIQIADDGTAWIPARSAVTF